MSAAHPLAVALSCACCGASFGEFPPGESLAYALRRLPETVHLERGFALCAKCWPVVEAATPEMLKTWSEVIP